MDESGNRRSDRIFTLVQIRVSGEDTEGIPFVEETATIAIGQHGASIHLTHAVLPDQVLRIRNLRNGIEESFRVVGEVQRSFGTRREWGVEILNPQSGIWGMDFTPPPEGVQPKVLVRCVDCASVAFRPLSAMDYSVLLTKGMISGHCERCDQMTRWKPSEEPPAGQDVFFPTRRGSVDADQRKTQRLRLAMRMRVQNSKGDTDFVQTIDVSKTGACFLSTRQYRVGEEVSITFPYSRNQKPVHTAARIVWCQEIPTGRLYGVNCEEPKTSAQ